MKKTSLFVLFLTILSTGCKSLTVQQKQYTTTIQKVVLGSVGQDENYILKKTYSSLAVPDYNKPIKVSATPILFNKTSLKRFKNAQKLQAKEVQVNYIDSLMLKPKFLNLQTVDDVALIALLNNNTNADIKNYLINKNNAHIVTSISIAFNENTMQDILKAEEVFLESAGLKSIALNLYNNKALVKSIHFNEGVVFAYRVSQFCWKENSKHQLEIVNLIEGITSCAKKTYKSAKRAKKEINYYKL
ncbi:hypothetical protein BZARG_382 [Bizionia argentinensis JUB59]|uniref:Lipoprotein n=1 Tax=Bizionia argentinensis JUB59 TaxID=1046627 RepID=G2EGZ5_9FLAO|nr:hypothetical protein [Bizionia argentinensis]EGV42287.1 hypothetical protein BZARG_382 [Bizionia argentinensis JUB59]